MSLPPQPKPVRIAILDSGVTEGHPHLPRVAGGVAIAPSGDHPDFRDILGHGTAVAALVHYLAPEAHIFAVKIFDRRLATSFSTVVRGLEWCLANQIDIINLSLGTANPDHRAPFAALVDRAEAAGSVIISAYDVDGATMLPGSMPGVLGATADDSLNHRNLVLRSEPTPHLAACPYPRDIEGIPREHNLRGVSFAVAHVSAIVAQRWHTYTPGTHWLTQLGQEAEATELPAPHTT